MIPKIKTGIAGLDELIGGGLPENTITLIYGPPKTGKSITCYQFLQQAVADDDFCLYIMTDYNLFQLEEKMMQFNWLIHDYFQKEMMYVLDVASGSIGATQKETHTLKTSSPQNPTEIISTVIDDLQYIYQKTQSFRSILDSTTTLFSFNSPILMIRVLKSYTMRMKVAGGTGIITYTQGVADSQIETMLKATVDNIIHLDGKKIEIEAMVGCDSVSADYKITDEGIKII
ncbi:MAG: RAD55 family ATPase [ANME-2 cluster archaeon]|nr:RAD55 family ATPase [ANME-2 cluster archaeon]